MVLLSPGSTAFGPLWEKYQVTKFTSFCCSTLTVLLFFIVVVNVLLYLINELNDERHIDRGENIACMPWDTWYFRHPILPRNVSLKDEWVTASGPSLLLTNTNSHSPRLSNQRTWSFITISGYYSSSTEELISTWLKSLFISLPIIYITATHWILQTAFSTCVWWTCLLWVRINWRDRFATCRQNPSLPWGPTSYPVSSAWAVL